MASGDLIWLAVHLPRLPLEALVRDAAEPMAAVAANEVLAANPAAEAMGVAAEMSAALALGLCPGLRLLERRPEAEAEALERLALEGLRFSSQLSLAETGLILEARGSLRLFGGWKKLGAALQSAFAELGFSTAIAAAPTPTAALWLARNGRRIVARRENLAEVLASLPLKGIAGKKAAAALAEMGVATVGACRRLPRRELARRFGEALALALDQAHGQRDDPRPPFAPPPRFASRLALPVPVRDVAALRFPFNRLLLELARVLEERGLGLDHLEARLFGEDGPIEGFLLRLSRPGRNAEHLERLLRTRLESFQIPAAVEAVALVADVLVPLPAAAADLFGYSESGGEADALIERLQARLGEGRVYRLEVLDDCRPEYAWRRAAVFSGPLRGTAAWLRPCWLLPKPRPIEAPKVEGLPESIATGWWDGGGMARNYYWREGEEGWEWVFRDRAGWRLHGLLG